jgi:hypothetical protein
MPDHEITVDDSVDTQGGNGRNCDNVGNVSDRTDGNTSGNAERKVPGDALLSTPADTGPPSFSSAMGEPGKPDLAGAHLGCPPPIPDPIIPFSSAMPVYDRIIYSPATCDPHADREVVDLVDLPSAFHVGNLGVANCNVR